MPQPIQAKHLQVDLSEGKFAGGSSEGTFSGYGSVFNHEDFGGDVIQKGAFKDTLKDWDAKGKLPKMLLQHGGGIFGGGAEDMVPIGKWTGMREDAKGLAVEGRLFGIKDTERGKSVHEAMREGELDGLSIGYRVKEYELGTKPTEPNRTIKKADLLEVSVVLFGMNDKALVDAVKSSDIDQLEDLSDCERLLREAAGFSRKTATNFVSVVSRIARREAGASKSLDGLLDQIRRTVRQTA